MTAGEMIGAAKVKSAAVLFNTGNFIVRFYLHALCRNILTYPAALRLALQVPVLL
jgi:hypothetical protein